ncbi:protein kinase [Actinomadura barringtoniae]|uniref:Protein kinase n=1 Tax=Actinomadura barringtoniae TaxID=1427535 RepID=A0A939PP01_9ACTN|nr:serine/threonine-protein kinase [Actinomadura barringtoniae]MBO2455503.1 protein kinase [Actinomadura barringtoniae]
MPVPLMESDPKQLGPYWLAARLGAGGQGVVYEGYDAQGSRVAVKALHADAVDEQIRSGLRKEISALQRVAAFCTARIIAADPDGAPPYIVSEYVPGPDLQSWVDRTGAYGSDDLYRLAIGIATALASIHKAGVIHRDLKPANVLLGPDGPRVIDFGIAKTAEMSRSATGMLKGTPRWMAPELFQGQHAGPAVDVWAWGAIVLFAATGQAPFKGDTMPSLMHQITTAELDLNVLTEPLRSLVGSALDRDPAKRPAPQKILADLVGGQPQNPLEAGNRMAGEGPRPSITLPLSLSQLAEQAYGRLDPQAQEAVPRVLLRMVTARPDAQDTLRKANLAELSDEPALQRVLQCFGEAGLLRHDGDTVTLGTAAMTRAWPRMRDWVDAERDGLVIHHALADAARTWNGNGRKSADLYQGSTLDTALQWASTGRRLVTLNEAERAFLDASQQQTRSRARLRTLVTAALAVLLLIATSTGATAVVQSHDLQQTNTTVRHQRDSAIGQQLATKAFQLRTVDPVLARRLAIAATSLTGKTALADHADDNTEVYNALLSLSSQWEKGFFRPSSVDAQWDTKTPNDGGLYTWGKGNSFVIADPVTRKVQRSFTVPGPAVIGTGQTHDGKRLLTLQQDGSLKLLDAMTGAVTPLPYRHTVGAGLYFSPSGSRLIVRTKGETKVLDTSGKPLFSTKEPYSTWDPAVSPDDRYLVSGKGKKLSWFDLQTGKPLPVDVPSLSYVKQLTELMFSPDGRYLAARHENEIFIIDAKTRKYLQTLDVPKGAGLDQEMAFSPDGRYLASDMALWSLDIGGKPIMHYKPNDECGHTRFGAGGTSLTCIDTQARVLSIDVTPFVRPVSVHRPNAGDSTISTDGSTLATAEEPPLGGNATAVQIWDTASGKVRGSLPISYKRGYQGDKLSLSDDGALLAHSRHDGTVDIWDVKSRTKRAGLNLGPPPSLIDRPAPFFSPDGKAVAALTPHDASTPALLQFFDLSGKQLGQARATKEDPLTAPQYPKVVWTKDGKAVVSSEDIGTVEFPSGKTLAPANSIASTTQAIGGNDVLVTVQDRVDRRSLSFWQAKTLKQIGNPIPTPDSSTPIAAMSPNGQLVATTDKNGSIDLWDVANQRRIGLALTGHAKGAGADSTEIHALAFSPDGSRLYSVGEDGRLVTHTIAPDRLKSSLCAETGQLTRDEWKANVKQIPYQQTC